MTCGAELLQETLNPVLQVLIQRGRDNDTVRMTVNNFWRGSITEGRSIESNWSKLPDVGSQWIAMGRVQDDGFFHVELQYPNEKANWVQRVLGILPPSGD